MYATTGSKKSADSDHAHSQAGSGYGYQGKLNNVLRTEFSQLQGKVYADHAGATLYTKSQIEALKQVCCSMKSYSCKKHHKPGCRHYSTHFMHLDH